MGKIFNISASSRFLEVLAEGVLQHFPNPHEVTIYLPNKRAIRSLSEAFLHLSGKPAMLLPNMQAVGDIDDDELEFSAKYEQLEPQKPAISPQKRLLEMAELLQNGERNLVQSISLAKSLIKLIDETQNKGVSFDVFEKIIPHEFAEHWQITLEFLKIASGIWAEKLAEQGLQEPIQLRNNILHSLAEYYSQNKNTSPVIIAGSTGSVPATAKLIKAIYENPNGHVVLFGLDSFLTAEDRQKLEETHPQKLLANLLRYLDASEVQNWCENKITERQKLISTALLPTHKIEAWQAAPMNSDIELLEADNIEEEAMAVAMILRECLEANCTSMVVTTNRPLARRIAAKMKIWDVEVNDSAGQPLLTTTSANFLLLLADMLASRFAPIDVLAFFKHPFIKQETKAKIRALELEHFHRPRQEHKPSLPELQSAKLEELFAKRSVNLLELLNEHIAAAENIAPQIWKQEGEELELFLQELRADIDVKQQIDPVLYPEFLRQMLSTKTYRPKYGQHKNVRILSPIEARLEAADCVIISSMNEGSFPNIPPADSFMNQQIRRDSGLDLLEKRIGQAAHDFELLVQSPKVILTRSKKEGGSPTQKSRFLQRLEAVAVLTPATKYVAWAREYVAAPHIPLARPAPKPPAEARPKELSATQIGKLLRDPYTIYAEKVLSLRKLDDIGRELSAADFGNFVHEAIEKFSLNYDGKVETLIKYGAEAFKPYENYVGAKAFWWNKFMCIAHKFVEVEQHIRSGQQILVEQERKLNMGNFTIKATADRVEVDEGITIIDYKTGAPPSRENIERGLEPQLPIEAIIFENEFGLKTTRMEYWHLKGTGEIIEFRDIDLKQVAATRESLPIIAAKIMDRATPFVARPWSYYALKYNDYEHLERIKEWAE